MNFKFHCSYSCSKFITTSVIWILPSSLIIAHFGPNFLTTNCDSDFWLVFSQLHWNILAFSTVPKKQHNKTFNITVTGCSTVHCPVAVSHDNHKTSQHTAALTLNKSARWQKVPAPTKPRGSTLLCRCSFSWLIASSHEKFARFPFSTAPPIFPDTNLHNTISAWK